MKNEQTNLRRRGFLLAAGVGSAGAVAVVAAAATGAGKEAVKAATVSAADKSGSYEESAHVSNYYRTARV